MHPSSSARMSRLLLAIAAVVIAQLLSGCASRPVPAAAASSVDPSTAGTIHVYQPAQGMAGKALRYYVYLDGARFGRINSDESVNLSVAPGRHEISVQGEFLGVLTGAATTLQLDVAAQSEFFVRFAVSTGDVRVIGTAVSASPSSSLVLVGPETWKRRW